MSLNDCNLTVVFSNEQTCERMLGVLSLLNPESMDRFNKEMLALGVKTRLKPESIYATDLTAVGNVLQADLSLAPDLKFPKAILAALPDITLTVVEVEDDSESGSKKSFSYQGKSLSKAGLSERLALLDKRLALVLSVHVGVRPAIEYFKSLDDPNAVYLGAPLFWQLIPFVGDSRQVQNLIAKCDSTVRGAQGDTVLHHAARIFGRCNEHDVAWLIDHGGDLNARNEKGETPLIVAAQKSRVRLHAAMELMRRGADIDAVDAMGCAAIHYACQQASPGDDLVRLLAQRTTKLNEPSPLGSPLWLINRACRNQARALLWKRKCDLIPPPGAYGDDGFENLKTAIRHHDLAAMDRYLAAATFTDSQVHQLYCHACHFECRDSFDRLSAISRAPLTVDARDVVFSDRLLLDVLFLSVRGSDNGDSFHIVMKMLESSSAEQVYQAASTPNFAESCLAIARRNNPDAARFFSELKAKGMTYAVLRGHLDEHFHGSSVKRDIALIEPFFADAAPMG